MAVGPLHFCPRSPLSMMAELSKPSGFPLSHFPEEVVWHGPGLGPAQFSGELEIS